MTIEARVFEKVKIMSCLFKKDDCVATCADCPMVTGDVFVVGHHEPKASDLSPPIPKRIPKENPPIDKK